MQINYLLRIFNKFFIADVLLPGIYMSAFTLASPNAGTVSIPALNKILGISGVPHATIEKVHIR